MTTRIAWAMICLSMAANCFLLARLLGERLRSADLESEKDQIIDLLMQKLKELTEVAQ